MATARRGGFPSRLRSPSGNRPAFTLKVSEGTVRTKGALRGDLRSEDRFITARLTLNPECKPRDTVPLWRRWKSGTHIKSVADILGQSSIATTRDVYGHASCAAITALGGVLGM
jgi:hypothetical protein